MSQQCVQCYNKISEKESSLRHRMEKLFYVDKEYDTEKREYE